MKVAINYLGETQTFTVATQFNNNINIYPPVGFDFIGDCVTFEYDSGTKILSVYTVDANMAPEGARKLAKMSKTFRKYVGIAAYKVFQKHFEQGQRKEVLGTIYSTAGGQRIDFLIEFKEDFGKKYADKVRPADGGRTSSLVTKLKKTSTERAVAPVVALVQPTNTDVQIPKTRTVDADMFDTLRAGGYELLSGTVLCKNSAGEIVEITIIN